MRTPLCLAFAILGSKSCAFDMLSKKLNGSFLPERVGGQIRALSGVKEKLLTCFCREIFFSFGSQILIASITPQV